MKLPLKLLKRLESRKQEDAFRKLPANLPLVDFCSNDYLGLAASREIFSQAKNILEQEGFPLNGATGSRLISGNHSLFKLAEEKIAQFHNAETALIFNSGYDANIGFFSSVPQRGDVILYDELAHASIRDGIFLGKAAAYKFRHNDIDEVRALIDKNRASRRDSEIYIVTESIFSMDGDAAPLQELVTLVEETGCFLIVDEAHATGVLGPKGAGLVQDLELENRIFARLQTFGKGLGCHGAAILGGGDLKDYLINYARSFIYTTGLPPHTVATALAAYNFLETHSNPQEHLGRNIDLFKNISCEFGLQSYFIQSNSAIQSCIIEGNARVKETARKFKTEGFLVKAILSPTVPGGKERLRFCLHSYNSEAEIKEVLKLLVTFIS